MKQRQPQFTVVSRYASVLLVMSSLFAADVCAQDSRPLKEPLAPSICQLLPAQLNMNEVDAQTLAAPDTQRLQQAINQCPSGKALRLVRHSDKNYFLTGALQMKAGVSLVIDAGVVLAGSRLPADYDKGEKSCGTVDQKGRGCRPLISVTQSQNAGLFGDGVIDGQGGKKILGGSERLVGNSASCAT
jgi:polygalacturonase